MNRLRVLTVALGALALSSSAALAQRRVLAKVVDGETQEALQSASVQVEGTVIGGATNDKGEVSLLVPSAPVTLTVRRIGYKRQSVTVGADQAEVTVAMSRDVLQLETQIVTGAATTVSSRNAANDVASVSASQLTKAPAASLENALAGRVAGATVSANGGAPGGGNQIRLRGVTSVFGSADPLYVIDGVIVSNDVIQTGSNAVTSAGRSDDASNQDNGVNRIADINPNDIERIEILKGASASAIYGSKASNGVIIITTKSGQSHTGKTQVSVVQRFGTARLSHEYGLRKFSLDSAYARGLDLGMDSASVLANYNSCGGFCDYEKQLYGQHPLNYETSLSARGGTDQTAFFASVLDKYDGGIEQNTGYRKQSARLNLTQNISDNLTFQLNTNLIRTLTRRGISNNDNTNITPYFVFAATPSFIDLRPKNGVFPQNPVGVSNFFQNAALIQTPEEVYRYIISGNTNYTAYNSNSQTLTIRLDGGVDRYNQSDNVNSPAELYFENNDGLPGTVTAQTGNVEHQNWDLTGIHTWAPGTYTATTSAGVQREVSYERRTNVVSKNVIAGQGNVDKGSVVETFANRQEIRGLAFFAQEEFLALSERLLLTAGARAERSTVNGDIKKYYFFPKASASYRFPSLMNHVDELKLRAAVGQSGNQPLYQMKYLSALTSVYSGQNGVENGPTIGDPNIKPERQTEIEGGFDATLFSSRASLSFTAYQKTINDVILQIAIAPSLGSTQQVQNGGSIRNRGIEALLALTPVQTADFTWISRTTFARNKGIVTSLPVPFYNVTTDATGGGVSFGSGYGQGRLQVGKSVTQIVANDTLLGVVQKGDAAPDFTMGFSQDMDYKHFHVSGLLDWSHGGDLVNVTQDVFDYYGTSADKPDGGVQRGLLNDAIGQAQYVQDASFVKLREISVGYDLPDQWVHRIFNDRAQSARLEFSGRNLYTWSKYPGVDPEVSNFGSQQISRFIDLAPFPPSRTFFFTIAADF